MHDAAIVYPHQLFAQNPVLAKGRPVYLVEEPLLLTYNPAHRARLILHKLSMDAYQQRLERAGHDVHRLAIGDHAQTRHVFEHLSARGVVRMHIADTADAFLERAIAESGLERVWYETPLFVLARDEARDRYLRSRRFMASFYKALRVDRSILLDGKGDPVGGKWSFDEDNRRKIPARAVLPPDIVPAANDAVAAAATWAGHLDAELYGEPVCWLPHTHEGARAFLEDFLASRFHDFGPYEDAITTRGVRLWHSALSPLLNIGLLTPGEVLDAALDYGARHDIPLNSLEGFVRQVLGWREFMRASYEVDGVRMRNSNFWGQTRPLPDSFWTGETGLAPVDHTIQTARSLGYTHHIERLMVMGNIMLLMRIRPHDVYRWFMGLYIDAYDWVMVPNVYGMSQFADGGGFATKPYISGANYIRKMSDHQRGDWEDVWTALYWNFISDHAPVFKDNHRLSMMPRVFERMDEATRSRHLETARKYLAKLHP